MSTESLPAPRVHPTAILSGDISLAPGVEIGPHCVLEGAIRLGTGVRLFAGVHILGPVEIGDNTQLYPGACIGFPPQDWKFKPGMPTAGVRIGSGCLIREHVTIHAATKLDAPTSVGDRCFLMVGSHLGHDARIGNDVVLVNQVMLGGHAQIADKATLGGGTAIHQFCRIGRLAFLSGNASLSTDVPPFCVAWNRNQLVGINVVGLRRNNVARPTITLIRKAFREVLRPVLPRAEVVARLEELGRECPEILEMAEFVRHAKRAITPGAGRNRNEPAPASDEPL